MTGKLTGGLVNYYLAPVTHPQRKEQPAYVAECEDIAEALGLTPNEFCEFKAIWRTANARKGNGKPDGKALYDAEKRLHYAGRDVAKYQRERDAALCDGWTKHTTGVMPVGLNGDDFVQVRLVSGDEPNQRRRAHDWSWNKESMTSAISHWRLAP